MPKGIGKSALHRVGCHSKEWALTVRGTETKGVLVNQKEVVLTVTFDSPKPLLVSYIGETALVALSRAFANLVGVDMVAFEIREYPKDETANPLPQQPQVES
jgi:hypothetical protein